MMINKRLINIVPESREHIVRNVAYKWISLLCNIAIMFIIGVFLEILFISRQNMSFTLGVFFVVSILVCMGIRIICIYKSEEESHEGSKAVRKKLRQMIYEKLVSIGVGYNQNLSTSEILQVSVEGIEQLETYFGAYLPQFFYSMLAPLTLFLIFIFIDFKVAIVLLICVPLIPISIALVMKFAKKLLEKYWGKYVKLGDSFLENLQGLTTLKIYQSDKFKHDEMNKDAEDFRIITMKVLSMQLNSITIMDLIAYGGSAIGIILAILSFSSGKISLASTFVIIMLSSEFFLPLRLLGSYFHVAMNGMAASQKMFEILDEEIETTKYLDIKFNDITINNLSYKYGDKIVLDNIDMDIPNRKFISIAGESGSGKSTIAKVIMGMNKNYMGSVKIGNSELKNVIEKQLMKKITLISSDSYIFKGSIAENLLISKPTASESDMWGVLEKLKLAKFAKIQSGLDTKIDEGGSNLSGGQRQRLAIARALLFDSDIYIFDEATSNIDVESENVILDLLQELSSLKTIILISHRLANLVKSDKIYVLEKGCVVESGIHDELVKNDNVYSKLWHSQMNLENFLGGDYEK